MLVLITFAFIAGVVTVLSPCILPILPIVLSGSLSSGKRRPVGIVTGFILSFTFFTLFLSTIVRATGISADVLRNASVVIVGLFGVSLLVPKFQIVMEQLFARISSLTPRGNESTGFLGGLFLGIGIGLIWTPCVGPILASVITLAATSAVNSTAVAITLSYSIGTAIPMLAIVMGGRGLLNRIPWLLANTGKIQKIFGIVMILTALAIYLNFDRKFQTIVLEKFPQYGSGLTSIEDNEVVKQQLDSLKNTSNSTSVKEKELIPESSAQSAPEIIPGGKWINSDPLAINKLKGKVVIVDFWTYTCINCIRTLPYLKDWYAKYQGQGLEIIGVHTPEFEFEKNYDNLSKAVRDFELKYPIVQDNDYSTWRVYNNRFWPAKYIIDANGKVRYSHFGEGAYDETEQVIQTLLKEAGTLTSDMPINNMDYQITAFTPETYVGWGRGTNFATPSQLKRDKMANYAIPANLAQNAFALEGDWTVAEEYALVNSVNSALEINYNATDVFLVLNSPDKTGRVKVILDGKETQTIEVTDNRLYELVKGDSLGKHKLRIEFLTPGIEVYTFTFG